MDMMVLVDLLTQCLKFNPEHRIGIKDLLRHPYFKDFHDKRLEEVCQKQIAADKRCSSLVQLKKKIRELTAGLQAQNK